MTRPKKRHSSDWIDRLSRLTQLVLYALYWSIIVGSMLLAGAIARDDPYKGPTRLPHVVRITSLSMEINCSSLTFERV